MRLSRIFRQIRLSIEQSAFDNPIPSMSTGLSLASKASSSRPRRTKRSSSANSSA
jgi:hypothetical protein